MRQKLMKKWALKCEQIMNKKIFGGRKKVEKIQN